MDANSSKLSTINSYVGLIYTLLTNVSNGVGAWTGSGVNTVLARQSAAEQDCLNAERHWRHVRPPRQTALKRCATAVTRHGRRRT